MRRVFDDGDRGRAVGLDIGRLAEPGRALVIQPRPRRDHDAQVYGDIVEFADGVEFDALGQGQRQFAAGAGLQRMRLEPRRADAVDQDAFAGAAQDDFANWLIRLRIGQGVEPDMFMRAITAAAVACLAIAVAGGGHAPQGQGFADAAVDRVLLMRQGLEGAGAPADVLLLDGEAPLYGAGRLAAVSVA